MSEHDLQALSDEALVDAFVKQDDRQALEVLLRRHEARVLGLAYRILGNRPDALDATQDVFLTVFRKAGSFRHQSAFGTWLFRLTTNACHDIGRRKARAPLPVETLPHQPSRKQDSPETRLDVARALRDLPEEQRVPIVMRDLYGMTYEEIARATGAPPGTVRSRIARGRSKLAGTLGNGPAGEPGAGTDRLSDTEL